MINKLLDVHGTNQAIGSDIRCSLASSVAASSIWDKVSCNTLQLAVNAFHGHAHNRWCQLENHPLYRHGFGLEDLETCKQIFASSNAMAPLIRHALHFHYIQYLNLHFNQWNTDRYLELSKYNVCVQFDVKSQSFQVVFFLTIINKHWISRHGHQKSLNTWRMLQLNPCKTPLLPNMLKGSSYSGNIGQWTSDLISLWCDMIALGRPMRGSNQTHLFHTTQHHSCWILVSIMQHPKQQSKYLEWCSTLISSLVHVIDGIL